MTTAALLACQARIASLETSLRIFNRPDTQAAYQRVANQLDDAWLDYERLETELTAKGRP